MTPAELESYTLLNQNIMGLWQQAVMNGRVGAFTLVALLAILVFKFIIYRIMVGLLHQVRDMTSDCRTILQETRQLLTATKAQSVVASANAERAAVRNHEVLDKIEKAAGDSNHTIPAVKTWKEGDPNRRTTNP